MLGSDVGIAGSYGLCDEVRFAHLVYMCDIADTAFYVLQIHAAACKDDSAEQLVGIIGRNLIPHVLDDFIHTCFHNLDELAKGDMNCAGAAYNPSQNSLFNSNDVAVGIPADSYTPSAASRQGQGIVPTPEEKKKAEAERRKREEEERKQREEEEARALELEEEKRRNSFWHKFTRKAKEFGKKIIDEEDE